MTTPAARAGDICGELFIPEGYELTCRLLPGAAESAVVRPVEGTFASLSELTIRRLEEPVEDPDTWLRRRLSFDLSGLESAVRDLFESNDSPFAESPVASSLDDWLNGIRALAHWPLEACDGPRDIAGHAGRELACEWRVGPLQQFLVMRLVERDGVQYAVTIRAMNQRRLRHLVAIANSF